MLEVSTNFIPTNADEPVLLGRCYGLLGRLATLMDDAKKKIQSPGVLNGVDAAMKKHQDPVLKSGAVALLAALPDGDAFSGMPSDRIPSLPPSPTHAQRRMLWYVMESVR